MGEHPDFLVGYESYTPCGLARNLFFNKFVRGQFLVDLANDLNKQADGDKPTKPNLSGILYEASDNLFSVGTKIKQLDEFEKEDLENVFFSDLKLVRAVGNMVYSGVSKFIKTFSNEITPYLKNNQAHHYQNKLDLSVTLLDSAWRISKPYTTIITRENKK